MSNILINKGASNYFYFYYRIYPSSGHPTGTDYHLLRHRYLCNIVCYHIYETGLVFVPFLPGDSLLFASGAFAAIGSLNIVTLLILLIVAALLGDTFNYWVGHFVGAKMVANKRMPLKKEHLEKTNEFFRKHGGKTIILARFVPIIRTFAPFVAGAGKMNYRKFIFFNVIGGVLWVSICTLGGYYFGNIPFVKDNFSIVLIGVVVLSLIPIIVEFWRNRRNNSLRVYTNTIKNSTRKL
jgi:membrane-associated protein